MIRVSKIKNHLFEHRESPFIPEQNFRHLYTLIKHHYFIFSVDVRTIEGKLLQYNLIAPDQQRRANLQVINQRKYIHIINS